MTVFTDCPTPVGVYYPEDNEGEARPVPCKRFKCPYCGKIRRKQVMDKVKRGFGSDRVRFLTLTIPPQIDNYKGRRLMKAWNRFRTRIKQLFSGFKYFWVKEFTKKGIRHLHIMINVYIPIAVIKRVWKKATTYTVKVQNGREERETFASITHISGSKKRKIMNAAGYMTKYMTKQMQGRNFDERERRYGFSRDNSFIDPEGFRPSKIYTVEIIPILTKIAGYGWSTTIFIKLGAGLLLFIG